MKPRIVEPRTKLEQILFEKGLSQREFLRKLNKKYPNSPMSIDHLCRIISGQKKHYTTSTLYRFCGVLKKKPNQILDFEAHI